MGIVGGVIGERENTCAPISKKIFCFPRIASLVWSWSLILSGSSVKCFVFTWTPAECYENYCFILEHYIVSCILHIDLMNTSFSSIHNISLIHLATTELVLFSYHKFPVVYFSDGLWTNFAWILSNILHFDKRRPCYWGYKHWLIHSFYNIPNLER